LKDYPGISKLWHPLNNRSKSPKDISHGSTWRVWLQCKGCPKCGDVHEWNARAFALTQLGGTIVCPACESRRSFCSCRSVATDKRLAAEWHEDNPSPSDVALGSSKKKHKWRCSRPGCGCVWSATPNNRSSVGSNCPECARKWSGKLKRGSVMVQRPDLVSEWDEKRNERSIADVSCGSDKQAWWVCKLCGQSWQTAIVNRTLKGSRCPNCREVHRKQPKIFISQRKV
jgi:hypothetical protein